MFTDTKNPRWSDASHTSIILDVQFEGVDHYDVFVASHSDCTTHGPLLYNQAVSGLFGSVQDSNEERIIRGELPVPDGYIVQEGKLIYLAGYEQDATDELNRRLTPYLSTESQAQAGIDEEYAAERKAKITALLAVKKQPGWPFMVEWP